MSEPASELPPGGAWSLVELRPVMKLPEFWLDPVANLLAETLEDGASAPPPKLLRLEVGWERTDSELEKRRRRRRRKKKYSPCDGEPQSRPPLHTSRNIQHAPDLYTTPPLDAAPPSRSQRVPTQLQLT